MNIISFNESLLHFYKDISMFNSIDFSQEELVYIQEQEKRIAEQKQIVEQKQKDIRTETQLKKEHDQHELDLLKQLDSDTRLTLKNTLKTEISNELVHPELDEAFSQDELEHKRKHRKSKLDILETLERQDREQRTKPKPFMGIRYSKTCKKRKYSRK